MVIVSLTPSSGIVLADRKDAESVSAYRQSPDQKASRCRVRLATGIQDPRHSSNRHTIFHDTYKIYGVLLFCLLFSKVHKSCRSEIGSGIYFHSSFGFRL